MGDTRSELNDDGHFATRGVCVAMYTLPGVAHATKRMDAERSLVWCARASCVVT
jgi:hypothetical protein